jgi:hypothetical protein
MKASRLFLATLIAAAPAASLASFVNPNLSGNTQYDGWDDYQSAPSDPRTNIVASANPGFPGFPGSGAWPAAGIGSGSTGSGDATLHKTTNGTGGGPYPASGSIYFGGFSGAINNNGGTLAVRDATPVAGVENVVFQVQIGEAWTYDFFNGALPTLSFNGGSQNLVATASQLVDSLFNGTVQMPTGPEDVFINTHLLQWDLSGLGPITDFTVSFTGVQHAQVYGLRLDQSDSFALVSVPEPTSLAFWAIGALAMTVSRRRRG